MFSRAKEIQKKKKNNFHIKGIMQLQKIFKIFFAHENIKNSLQKLLIIPPNFFSVLDRLSKQSRNRNPVPPKAP